MPKAEPKTQRTKASVAAFIAAVDDDTRKDAKVVDKMMGELTGEKPAMWGPSIVGYGEYTTRGGPWPRIGFSPRKANLVLYIMDGYDKEPLMKKLGKHKAGKGCVYITNLADVDQVVLRDLIARGVDYMRTQYVPN